MVDIVTYRWHKPWEYIATRKHGKPGVLYTEEHIGWTHNMIRKNMSLPFQIYHYSKGASDKVGEDVISCDFEDDYEGWYLLFSFMRRERPFLFVGIDNVIVKDLAPFVEYAEGKGLHTCQSYAPGSAHTGIVWVENCQKHADMFDEFWHDDSYNKKKWQDEMFIERKIIDFKTFPAGWSRSYKNHYKKGKRCKEAKYFHFTGFPKHYEVEDEWVIEALKG